jgi:hypothetical protein
MILVFLKKMLRKSFLVFCLSASLFYHAGAQVLTQSELPILIINTNGQAIQDEPKITADMKVLYKGPGVINKITDQPAHYNGKIGIEFRGSSSQGFPKKPYGVELRDNTGEEVTFGLLDLPKESDWTLNATYNDKSLMRDALAYILAASVMEYAPRVRHVELILNNQYQGVYMLIEKIKRDKNRVNIAKLEKEDQAGDALTGGYIFKIDKESGSNSGAGWISPYKPIQGAWQHTFFQYEYPKATNITEVQKNYIKDHVTRLEHVLSGPDYRDPVNGYKKFMDAGNIADFIIINELSKNPDAYRLSTFLYKERDSDGGKIKFGPVWDFNLAFGNVDYCTQGDPEGLVIQQFNQVCPGDYWVIHFWWKKFMEDPALESVLKNRWRTLRAGPLSEQKINFVIDSIAGILEVPQKRNFQKWPVLGTYLWPNYFVGATYKEEVDYLKGWTSERLKFLDIVWGAPSAVQEEESRRVRLFPNPATHHITVLFEDSGNQNVTVTCTDMFGRVVVPGITQDFFQSLEMDISGMPDGVYIIRVVTENQLYAEKILIQK